MCVYLAGALGVRAQGTAISYQGRLYDGGMPANTNYDFRFAVFNAPTNGASVSPWVTNTTVPVSNGLFTVILNFGPGIFNGTTDGSNDWMDVSVRASGATTFVPLTPRQPILPVPYALFATSASNLLGTVSSAHITGFLTAGGLSGTYTNGISFGNVSNTFTGAFTGDGSQLTNLNASALAAGTVPDERLATDVPLLGKTQTFSGVNTFSGGTVLSGPNTFSGTGTFTASNYFGGTGYYAGSNVFINNGNSFYGSFFGNGLVGWIPVNGTATNAMRDAGYLTLNAGLTTVTLPTSASLSVGDIVRVSGGGAGGWLIKENAGQSITGNFAAYRNSYVSTLPVNGGSYSQVAASADGRCLYAVSSSGFTGVYASYDGGENWNQVGATYISGYNSSIACSADGKILYLEYASGGTVQKSIDGGNTWAASTYSATGVFISCTADGSKVFTSNYACSGNGNYLAKLASGAISISSNGGTTFNAIATSPASGVNCLAASSDCTRLVAGVNNGLLYASANGGASWTTLTTTNQVWAGLWMSPDGSKIIGAVAKSGSLNGGVFTTYVIPQPNTANVTSTLCGSQGSAVELQYLGGGQFVPASSTGLIWSN